MGISRTFWPPATADWWHQQEETHSKYANLSNVAPNIVSIIPHCVGVEANFALGQDVISWRQWRTAGEMLCEKVILTQFAQANNGILAGDFTPLDTTETEYDLELKNESEER